MNITFVSKECPPSPRSFGIGTYVWETGCALAKCGHCVTVISASDDGELTNSSPLQGFTVIRLPDDEMGVENRSIFARTFRAPYDQGISYRKRLADYLVNAHRQIDIIEFPGFRGESVVWLSETKRPPMVVRMHGSTAGVDSTWKDHISASRRLRVAWERQELMSADAVTAVSENQAFLSRHCFGGNHIHVLHNSIDSKRWAELSSDSPPNADQSDVLFVGSLFRSKGIFTLIEAASLLRRNGWHGRLLLAGRTTPEFARFLRARSGISTGFPHWVVMLGVLPRERLAGFYRDVGVCCFPSSAEAFSYVCLEAMACGGIVVGSSGTGMSEIITPGSGFLVTPGDVNSLAAAINKALTLAVGERSEMKVVARERIRKSFDHDVILPKLLDIYNAVIHHSAWKH